MKLGTLISDFRASNHLSQREFARRCNLSNSLISILEKGINPQTGKEVSPDLETYVGISRAMGITTQALFEMLGRDAKVHLTSITQDGVTTIPGEDSSSDYMILSRGIKKMSCEQQKKLLDLAKVVFPDCFEEE